MKLDLYIAGVPHASLANWVVEISAEAEPKGIEVVQSAITEAEEVLQEQIQVVLDELCAMPEQRVSFSGENETVLQAFAYKSYHARFNQGWNVCLYSHEKAAIYLHFDENLLAKRVGHFYYQEGTSDKVYQIYLVYALTIDFYSVISRYGRRSKSLQQKEKSFDYRLDDAEQAWNRLYHDKIQKGYKVGQTIISEQLEFKLF